MHKLMEYVCREMEEIERKVGQGQNLTLTETQYLDMLAHIKKDLLTSEAMEGGESKDSSYRRGRDSMGRYTSRDASRDEAKDDIIRRLKEMERNSNSTESRSMLSGLIREAENY